MALEMHYRGDPPPRPRALRDGVSMWRWRELLPPVSDPVSLGEGATPLVRVPSLRGVWVKDERVNPTGSFKDRLVSAAVSWAGARGFQIVAVASTGNAALSTAAYCAAAGLRCVVLAKSGGTVSPTMEEQLQEIGAEVRFTASWQGRWAELERGVHESGWFPVSNYRSPPVSSHPVGVRAYRTLAYEIAGQFEWSVPDWITVPVSRGDALCATVAGFDEMRRFGWISRVPRMLAVVRFPSLRGAVHRGREQPQAGEPPERVQALSISDPQSTAAAVLAVRRSEGDVLVLGDAQLAAAQTDAAARGWPMELSSAAAMAGAAELRRRGHAGRIVALVTAARESTRSLPALTEVKV